MRKRRGRPFLTGLALLSAAVWGFGCSKKASESPPVAAVGEEKILAGEITEILERQRLLFPSAEEELAEKMRLLDSLVETRLLVQEAYRQKLDQDSLIRAFAESERPLFLLDVLYFREARDKVRLTNAEVLRYYRAFRTDRCFKQILTFDGKLADSLLSFLRRGARFDSLALLHSKDPLSAPKGGDIGWYGWSRKLPEPLFARGVEMKPGDLAGPFRMPEGWLLLQCYEQRPAQLPDLRLFEPELRKLLEPSREADRAANLVVEIRKNLNFRIVDSTARFVNLMQKELSKVVEPGRPERYSIYLQTDMLSSAQRDMPLLTFKGGAVTAGQYLQTLQGSRPMDRLVLDTTEETKARLFQLVFQEAMVNAALSKGLDKDPEFLKLFKGAVEGRMALLLKARLLSSVRIDSPAVRSYFGTHSEEFLVPAALHLFEINRPSREEIDSLKKGVRDKGQLLAAASRFTARTHLRPLNGELGWVEQHQFPELFAAAAKMKKGQIAGPIELADGSFSLIYLEAKRPARKQSFGEVKEGLWQRLWMRAADSAFAVWTAGQKKKTPVAVYPEVLQKTVDPVYYAKLKEWREQAKEGTS
ncbi:MAG: peptidyl-prolyl cis-trans isomerase [candidate division Zixibacteria bacterium]|nr:peptidyl-prolyl cis-trans isomerase [candidate division Zixibacteria bacterium]